MNPFPAPECDPNFPCQNQLGISLASAKLVAALPDYNQPRKHGAIGGCAEATRTQAGAVPLRSA